MIGFGWCFVDIGFGPLGGATSSTKTASRAARVAEIADLGGFPVADSGAWAGTWASETCQSVLQDH